MGKRKRTKGKSESTKADGSSLLPQKRHYRQRAHANPFSDHNLEYPASPDEVDWSTPEFADVGCGFGGLLIALAPLYPDTLMLGLEIRVQVSQYVEDRIAALRAASSAPPPAQPSSTAGSGPASSSQSTVAPALPSALFFLFPDPHFKLRKHKARIISPTLLAEYAYVLRPGGVVYTITDVKDLAEWMDAHLSAFPLFESVDTDTLRAEGKGPILDAVWNSTEEGKKVERNKGEKWLACFRRIELAREVVVSL
ncbi:putative methyltransferase [Russula vinacea]|nr:putative methyltransferase [Russula vinacea]